MKKLKLSDGTEVKNTLEFQVWLDEQTERRHNENVRNIKESIRLSKKMSGMIRRQNELIIKLLRKK